MFGRTVPAGNEAFHLVRMRAASDPAFMAGDWTFGQTFPEYWLFDLLTGPLVSLLSMEAMGWVGRLVTWPILLGAIWWLGVSLGARPWPLSLAIAGWLAIGQSLISGEWMFLGFEPKVLSYIALVAAMTLAIRATRVPLAVGLIGVAFSLHPSVGLWGGLALGTALLWSDKTRTVAIRSSWLAVLTATPGAVAILGSLGEGTGTRADWRFLTLVRMPWHTDLAYPSPLAIVASLLMAGVVVYLWRSSGGHMGRIIVAFQTVLVAEFSLGTALWMSDQYRLMATFPLRVFGVMTPLLFGLAIAAWWSRSPLRPPDPVSVPAVWRWVVLIALVAAILGVNPVLTSGRQVVGTVRSWVAEPDDTDRALSWVAREFGKDQATVIVSPARTDAHYLAETPVVVTWRGIRYDDVAGWRQRMDDLTGGPLPEYTSRRIDAAFRSLSRDDIDEIAARYGARFLVTDSPFPGLALLHQEGTVSVYAIRTGSG